MRTLYDELIQQKPKELSKTLSEITYKYENPETHQQTVVPAKHFEKELSEVMEKTISEAVNRQFLSIMFSQLNDLKKDNEQLFYQALMCIDNNLNPKNLKIAESIAINHTYKFMKEKQDKEKKGFRFLNQDVCEEFNKAMNDKDLQAKYVRLSNEFENEETRELNEIEDNVEQNKKFFENNYYNNNEEDRDNYDIDI